MSTNCTYYGVADGGSQYSRPLPWVGLYVAAASLACFSGLTLDLYRSLRHRKLWIASNFFSLNAATLTALAVAAKIPSDITTPMLGVFDQLAKLSGTVLVCIVMNHVMPSLGLMSGPAILSNVAALGILVATVSANVAIQVYTGVVSAFVDYNLIFSIAMVLMFAVFVSYSLTVTTTGRFLKKQYDSRHEKICGEMMMVMTPTGSTGLCPSTIKLRDCLDKYWLMALTSSPDYTLRCSGMSMVSAALCHGTAGAIFIQATAILLTNPPRRGGGRPCLSSSDYKWSVPLIFVLQAAAIVVGSVASFLRISSSRPTSGFASWGALTKIERHWVELLEEWRDAPLPSGMRSRRLRKGLRGAKSFILGCSIKSQVAFILVCKVFLLTNVMVFRWTLGLAGGFLGRLGVFRPCDDAVHEEGEESSRLEELSEYVLQLEGTEETMPVAGVVQRWRRHPQRWIGSGKMRQPAHLLRFLRAHLPITDDWSSLSLSEAVMVPAVASQEVRKCWALPLVTLAAIALTVVLPDHQVPSASPLMSAVREGLRFVRFVESNCIGLTQSRKLREAADMVWEGVDLDGRWLGVELHTRLAAEETSARALQMLADEASRYLDEGVISRNSAEWPSRALAAHCMHKTIGIISSNTESGKHESELPLLAWVESIVACLLGDCLVNLPLAIFRQCFNGEFGKREEGVREAALVLGEAEELLEFLETSGSRLCLEEGGIRERSNEEGMGCCPLLTEIRI